MVFRDLLSWGLGSVDMDTSLCSSSLQSTFSSWLWLSSVSFSILLSLVFSLSKSSLLCWVQSVFGLRSLVVHVESPIIVVFFRFTCDVLIGSFSDMIFYLEYVAFSHEYALHILRWCAFVLSIWYIFHLYIMITLAWSIMEDIEPIEPIDLGLGDRPREFETVTHFTFRSEQYHIHIHTLTLWTCWPTHLEPDMTPPLGTITRLYYLCSP